MRELTNVTDRQTDRITVAIPHYALVHCAVKLQLRIHQNTPFEAKKSIFLKRGLASLYHQSLVLDPPTVPPPKCQPDLRPCSPPES